MVRATSAVHINVDGFLRLPSLLKAQQPPYTYNPHPMIRGMNGSQYRCANAYAPTEASLICFQEGCTFYPFLCGSASCSCMTLHGNHPYRSLNWLLKELAAAPRLPPDLVKEEKEINKLIDRLIGGLQSLKKHHQGHVDRHTLGYHRYAGLLQRLHDGE